jgi:hypothetical protein
MEHENCIECGVNYPSAFLAPLASSSGVVGPVCGICALDLINAIHGTTRDSFDGSPRAEQMR